MRTIDQMILQEVHYCVSSLVTTLAATWHVDHVNPDADALHEQAQDLCQPIADWESAALYAGWTVDGTVLRHAESNMIFGGIDANGKPDWEALGEEHGIAPDLREIYEHWIVSDWLAEKLEAKGERVDMDLAGLTVWARTTSGQGIAQDAVIAEIYADIMKPQA